MYLFCTNQWITNDCGVRSIFLNYYQNLFTTSDPSQRDIDYALEGLEERVTEDMRNKMMAPYTADEVKHTLFGMAPWKAPGPDGFHAGFY